MPKRADTTLIEVAKAQLVPPPKFVLPGEASKAVFAPLLAPYGEAEVVGGEFEPWNSTFLLGTDNLGRDMLSRLIYGARNTIGVALLTTIIAFVIGGLGGLLAATLGGWTDEILSRIVDVTMAIPGLIFALLGYLPALLAVPTVLVAAPLAMALNALAALMFAPALLAMSRLLAEAGTPLLGGDEAQRLQAHVATGVEALPAHPHRVADAAAFDDHAGGDEQCGRLACESSRMAIARIETIDDVHLDFSGDAQELNLLEEAPEELVGEVISAKEIEAAVGTSEAILGHPFGKRPTEAGKAATPADAPADTDPKTRRGASDSLRHARR